ncbi:MAG: TIGR02117 family protein [Planctomycetes bacterium]|nr:TIGR02117 family protein [Planctomycetota bacterium]
MTALRWLMRIAIAIAGMILAYVGLATICGIIPVNTDYEDAPDGTEIFVSTNGVHCDFALPAKSRLRDWTETLQLSSDGTIAREAGRQKGALWVHFGWGERHFYLDTPTWSDLEVSTALGAVFWPTTTLMHVSFSWMRPDALGESRRLVVDDARLGRLIEYIEGQFARDEHGAFVRLDNRGYGNLDDFYEARGSYHALHTCNDWVNAGLKHAGIRAALWSPFDKAILYQLGRIR